MGGTRRPGGGTPSIGTHPALDRHKFKVPPGYTSTMKARIGRRFNVILSDRQHAFLADEAERTGLSMGELVRRAVDTTYRPDVRPRLRGVELSVSVWRRPDAATAGRRPLHRA